MSTCIFCSAAISHLAISGCILCKILTIGIFNILVIKSTQYQLLSKQQFMSLCRLILACVL